MSKKCDLTNKKGMNGNNVPKSRKRTRRIFSPNIRRTSFKSNILNTDFLLKVTTDVLRTINKYGDLDSFIINTKQSKLSDSAKKIKKDMTKSLVKNNCLENIKIFNKSKIKKSKFENKRKTKKKSSK